MFNSNKKTTPINLDRIDTLIGKNTGIEGALTAEGTVRIDGKIKGDVILSGNLIVGNEGSVKGNVKADSISLSGVIEGNVTVANQLHLTPTSRLIGDIDAKNIIVDEGAIFHGNCKMTVEEAAVAKE